MENNFISTRFQTEKKEKEHNYKCYFTVEETPSIRKRFNRNLRMYVLNYFIIEINNHQKKVLLFQLQTKNLKILK